ncbi:hypothetical protein ATANTOWER_029549 [Ataeniobius toweri]|uniref:NADH dehydrogenase subunit 6 n=1 Tax=Ataeniobius toweri TaxID=208326 RepID=A0ABU7BKH7_9TELE|nr:hypothetical protein [Ataeniobius toweri]
MLPFKFITLFTYFLLYSVHLDMFWYISFLCFSLSAPAHLLFSLTSLFPFIGLSCSSSPPDYTPLFAMSSFHHSLCIYIALCLSVPLLVSSVVLPFGLSLCLMVPVPSLHSYRSL